MRRHLALAAALLVLPAVSQAQVVGALDRDGSVVRPAGFGTAERSTEALREADTAIALETLAEVDAYQQEAGKVGQILGADLRVKRLGLDMQGDHDRVSGAVETALRRTDLAATAEPALPGARQARLASLYRVAPEAFDDVFLTTQIAADRETLQDLEAVRSPRLDSATAQAIDTAEAVLQRRLGQAERIRNGG